MSPREDASTALLERWLAEWEKFAKATDIVNGSLDEVARYTRRFLGTKPEPPPAVALVSPKEGES